MIVFAVRISRPVLLIVCALSIGCGGSADTPPPPFSAPFEIAASGATIAIAVGDIGVCGAPGDERTAQLADSILRVDSAARIPAQVLTLGDNAYPAGLDMNFVRCFGSSWGDPHKRIIRDIRPSIGNHDYQSRRGAAYYRYFGDRAGIPFKGYYSFELGDWHAIALNSEIVALGTDSERKQQEDWLRNDLRSNSRMCTLAFFHRPAFSSGAHGPSAVMREIWKILADAGVDLVLNGHDHHYERFVPLNSSGAPDTLSGMVEIIAGTGGGALTTGRSRPLPTSAMRVRGHWGILLLSLSPSEYRTAFLDVDGRVWDSNGRKCH